MENEKLNEMLKSIWDNLTDEQKEKARSCKTAEELTALAGKEGAELQDQTLDDVAGGYVFEGSLNGAPAYVVMDDGGGVHETYLDLGTAKQKARDAGYSDKLIDEKQLKKIRGRC